MKKLLIIMFGLVLLLETGCEGYLDEDLRGKVLGGAVLSSQPGLESALTGAYKGMGSTWSYGFLNGWSTEVSLGGDDVTCPASMGDPKEFDIFTVDAANGSTASVYNGCYKTIQGANNVITYYNTTVGDPDQIQIIAGEAYFLRALCYFWLVRYYGDLPLMTTPDFSLDQLTMEKSSAASIYELIEEDLKMAEVMLADEKRDIGRPNKGSAKAVLADVYITEAGWPLKDQSKYALAAAKAKEVIDNHEAYGFELLPTFTEVFENDPTQNGTAEDVFAVTASLSFWSTSNALVGYWAMPGEMGGWDVVYSELNFFKNFPEGPRKRATFAYEYPLADGSVVGWEDLVHKHPYYKKLWINENDPGFLNYASGLPNSMMRYAHVLTIYAEAKARSGGPDALAYECLNSIRTRSELEPLSGLSATEFADAVVQERAWEFAGERTRWFDIVRLETVAEVNSHRDPADNVITKTITEADYTFPLPMSELLVNPNLDN